jgi:hypothetical protein
MNAVQVILIVEFGFHVKTDILPNWISVMYAVNLFIYIVGLVEFR